MDVCVSLNAFYDVGARQEQSFICWLPCARTDNICHIISVLAAWLQVTSLMASTMAICL